MIWVFTPTLSPVPTSLPVLKHIKLKISTRTFGSRLFSHFRGKLLPSVLRAAPSLENIEFNRVYGCDLDDFNFVLGTLKKLTMRDCAINERGFAKLLSLTPNLEQLYFQSEMCELVHHLSDGDPNYQITPAQARDFVIMHCPRIRSVELQLGYATFEGEGKKKELAELSKWFELRGIEFKGWEILGQKSLAR